MLTGTGCVQSRTSGDKGDSPLPEGDSEREGGGGRTRFGLMEEIIKMSLDRFQADVLATRAKCERSDAILVEMGVEWSHAFLSSCYPRSSRNLIANYVRIITKLSIGLLLALYVTSGLEIFLKGPAVV